MPTGRRVDHRRGSYRGWSKCQLARALAALGVQVAPEAFTRAELVRLLEQQEVPGDLPRTRVPSTPAKELLAAELAQLGKVVNPDAMTRRELMTLLNTTREQA